MDYVIQRSQTHLKVGPWAEQQGEQNQNHGSSVLPLFKITLEKQKLKVNSCSGSSHVEKDSRGFINVSIVTFPQSFQTLPLKVTHAQGNPGTGMCASSVEPAYTSWLTVRCGQKTTMFKIPIPDSELNLWLEPENTVNERELGGIWVLPNLEVKNQKLPSYSRQSSALRRNCWE